MSTPQMVAELLERSRWAQLYGLWLEAYARQICEAAERRGFACRHWSTDTWCGVGVIVRLDESDKRIERRSITKSGDPERTGESNSIATVLETNLHS